MLQIYHINDDVTEFVENSSYFEGQDSTTNKKTPQKDPYLHSAVTYQSMSTKVFGSF